MWLTCQLLLPACLLAGLLACSFEIKISASLEGTSLRSLTGNLAATAVVEANSPTTPTAAAGTAAATQDVSSPLFPYEFIPKLQSAGGNSTANSTGAGSPTTAATADTPSSVRNLAVGSCADLSAGVILVEELPIDAAAQAAAVAAAGANGTTADGRGGKCLRVCGLEFPAGTNVTVMAPVTGYAQQQCGTTQVSMWLLHMIGFAAVNDMAVAGLPGCLVAGVPYWLWAVPAAIPRNSL
jgi:hypothetical protein